MSRVAVRSRVVANVPGTYQEIAEDDVSASVRSVGYGVAEDGVVAPAPGFELQEVVVPENLQEQEIRCGSW